MAEYEIEEPQEVAVEVKVVEADIDDFAKVVQEKFEEARDYRRDHEQHWLEAYDAYRGKYPSKISKAHELASERGIFVNQTRRKINSAKIKINTLLFEDGKVPFSITPSRKPRFYAPDIQAPPTDLTCLRTQFLNAPSRWSSRFVIFWKEQTITKKFNMLYTKCVCMGRDARRVFPLNIRTFLSTLRLRLQTKWFQLSRSLNKN